ncbi:zinc dependent phospholipase C [Mucilaginibacter gracilis]|uniref:Zinc dependent phospholipase C n=1 Tax=Mucilaginibacter gracilis TaxID=423350 RepID=A0A495J8P7_9SPHI|nr:zinc dependent phospholipase C family protein [Mucilaginibacter gracilis]RKR85380.1 zinc dependent phospholipase C [Mucilaginibacter gracilis]
MPFTITCKRPILLLLFILLPCSSQAYSILTHEALIDASWDKSIKPLLKAKFPAATPDELLKAHAYAYGGCLIADIGYSPFGSAYFTNLAHYVRTGDFVENMIAEAQNINEYAFALGTLCHYMADRYGHSIGTNHVVPLVYPNMKKKYGPVVTYEENHASHSKVEISFDVLQLARGNYASQAYHDFIGFEISRPVLERAFLKTYGNDINDVFGDMGLAISTFRWTVNKLMPTVTRAAWVLKKDDIKKLNPTITSRKFHYKLSRKKYYKEFGSDRQRPGFSARVLSFIITILPKVGPLKALKFQVISPEGEKLFIHSFDSVLVHYDAALTQLHNHRLELLDVDYDTGQPTTVGEYGLADKTYCDLLINLQKVKYDNLTDDLQNNILKFYNKADTLTLANKYPDDWKKADLALKQIKTAPTIIPDSLKDAKGKNYKLNEPALTSSN